MRHSRTDDPACLVLIGAEEITVKVKEPRQPIHLDMSKFFGGAVIMPDVLFRQVDGYSNEYWGWGFEDMDLVGRFKTVGVSCIRRPGTFCPLAHDSHRYEADGGLNADAALNRARYLRRWRDGKPAKADGLSTLSYQLLSRERLLAGTIDGNGRCERIKVRLFRPNVASYGGGTV